MKKTYVKSLLDRSQQVRNEIRMTVMDVLNQLGATDREHAIEFDYEQAQAPSILSENCGNDLADVYIARIWIEKGFGLRADYHNSNVYEDWADEEDVDLENEPNLDCEEILLYLVDFMPDEK